MPAGPSGDDRSAATLAVAFRVVGVLSSDVLGNAQSGLREALNVAASPSLLSNPRAQSAARHNPSNWWAMWERIRTGKQRSLGSGSSACAWD